MQRFAQTGDIGFKVHDEIFEIRLARPDDPCIDSFAEIRYEGERTLIRTVPNGRNASGGRDYRMISFIGEFSLDMVGFLASISEALAKKNIPIFVISSYRTDHLLLIKQDLEKGIEALESLGMIRR
jgi:uncharacterized protein